jgi:hypothetical protein
MAMLSRSPGRFGEAPQRAPLCATVCIWASAIVWFLFKPGFVWYPFSSGPPPRPHRYLSKPSLTWTHVITDALTGLPCFAISGGRVAKATLWERYAVVKAFDDVGVALDLQVRERTAHKWLR